MTHKRTKFLCESENVSLLREAFKYVIEKHPFTIDAFVLLPDHLHCLWTLPDGDHDFSKRWRLIKTYFTRKCDDKYKHTPPVSSNFGDAKSVGKGVYELKIQFGPGYRVYYGLEGSKIVVLLCAGDKSSQKKDIKKAVIFWREHKGED